MKKMFDIQDQCKSYKQLMKKMFDIQDQCKSYKQLMKKMFDIQDQCKSCLLYTSPSPRDGLLSRMPSSA